jgi:predicted HAD superfamily Cof-like phosphohydrolase
MFNPIQDVVDFHTKFGFDIPDKPTAFPQEILSFRANFLMEETDEYHMAGSTLASVLATAPADDAFVAEMLEEQFDAMIDLMYVTLGNVVLQGMHHKFVEGWNRVHAANMAKRRAEHASESKRGSSFDVVKPPEWVAPSHTDLMEDHAHRSNK